MIVCILKGVCYDVDGAMIRSFQKAFCIKAKEKNRGMPEIQKSGDKTSPGEIGLDIRTHSSPKVRVL